MAQKSFAVNVTPQDQATRIGAPALRTDLVDIFDYAGSDIVGTVAQQRAFHNKWAEFFRR
jgi:hypothetical protein